MPDAQQSVPSFFVYGEPDRPLDVGFIHVETVMARRHVHFGQVRAHKHGQMAQVTFWTSGRGEYFIEDRVIPFVAPAVSFIPSGTVHGFHVEPEITDAVVASIADTALPLMKPLSGLDFERPLFVTQQNGSVLWDELGATMQRLQRDYRDGHSLSLAALLTVVVNDIARLAKSSTDTVTPDLDLAISLKSLVDSHFRDNWPLERYVEALSTTPHLLAKACRQAYGQSVKSFIDDRRLLEAKRLLLFTVRSVEDITFELGFRDPAYFSRFFRKHVGEPPGEWRAARMGKLG
jgi:AraC family transcriptional activator of pobA